MLVDCAHLGHNVSSLLRCYVSLSSTNGFLRDPITLFLFNSYHELNVRLLFVLYNALTIMMLIVTHIPSYRIPIIFYNTLQDLLK